MMAPLGLTLAAPRHAWVWFFLASSWQQGCEGWHLRLEANSNVFARSEIGGTQIPSRAGGRGGKIWAKLSLTIDARRR